MRMNMKKRMLSLILTLALLFFLTVTAIAEGESGEPPFNRSEFTVDGTEAVDSTEEVTPQLETGTENMTAEDTTAAVTEEETAENSTNAETTPDISEEETAGTESGTETEIPSESSETRPDTTVPDASDETNKPANAAPSAESPVLGVPVLEDTADASDFTAFSASFKDDIVTLYKHIGDAAGMEWRTDDIGDFSVIAEAYDVNGTLWYELDFVNGGLDSLGYRYVPAECVIETPVTPVAPQATVSGAPDGYTLEIQNVSINIQEFGIQNESDVIAALDISLEKDGVVWQGTDEQESVAVSVDMTQYDIADGTVVRVHHQHDDEITTIEPLIIINGKLTFATDRFSVFVVEKALETTVVEEIEGNEIVMTVGEEKIYYWAEGDTVTTYNSAHFWVVDDPEGHIYPQVHSLGASKYLGNQYWIQQHRAPWITIKANKATPEGEPVKLTMKYGRSNSEEFTLTVVNPDGLYIQDDLVDNGVLIPQGIDMEGVTLDWSRSDGQAVNTAAISEEGALNVSIDRGGLTPSRTSPITYTVTAKHSNGTVLDTAAYTVNYATQIMNSSFEYPTVTNEDGYQSYPNHYAGLYWKTTAPGSNDARSMDVELMVNGNTSYLANQAPMVVADGKQAAELNAEAVGTLYQDLLTTPGATLTWSVSHAARTSETSNNTMYIIVAATKVAQDITAAADVKALLDSIPEDDREIIGNPEYGHIAYEHVYDNVTFYIWKHTATRDASAQEQWHQLSGSVRIPDGQYLTRFFFASDPYATTDATKGNLIDGVAAAEMLRYKIRYHIDGVLDASKNQTGTAAVTTTVSVRELKNYLENGYEFDTEKDGGYIQINGNDHVSDYNPADKSLGLYITDYPGSSGDADTPILLDIYLKNMNVSLTIKKVVVPDEATSDQVFLFRISGGTTVNSGAVDMTVSVGGNREVTISGLKVGEEYTVEEITAWSWRYQCHSPTIKIKLSPNQNNTVTFTNIREKDEWLNGFSEVVKNVFGVSDTGTAS